MTGLTRHKGLARSPMPDRKKPMARASAKTLKAAGGVLFSTFTKLPRPTGPSREVVELVLERDRYCCAWCAHELFGDRGFDWSIGHRRPRRNGGDPRPDTNWPSNLVALHGSGTTGCHGEIERERHRAEVVGFLLSATAKPHEKRIRHAIYGWCLLNPDGTKTAKRP